MEENTETDFRIRDATERDCGTIHTLIRELAAYERLAHQVVGTEDDVRRSLFGPEPRAAVLLAEAGHTTVGFALFFHNYSTFLCRRGLYLEDLYVRPEYRGRGYGKRLLSRLAQVALEGDCGRIEWAVLGWNESAVRFYESIGAVEVEGWKLFRLTASGINELAAST